MYAVWLVCGPEEDKMTYVFSKCRSFTTDFGTEMHGTEIPWLLTAVLAWLGGRKIENCRDLIDFQGGKSTVYYGSLGGTTFAVML